MSKEIEVPSEYEDWNQYQREWRLKNKEKVKIYSKKCYLKNKSKRLAYQEEYRKNIKKRHMEDE